jgi:CBS domain-containing protein
MFAMYDDDGLNFRTSLDNLYDIHKVEFSQKINNNTKNKESKNSFQDTINKKKIIKKAKETYEQIGDLHNQTTVFNIDQIMSHTALIINDKKTIKECYDIIKKHKVQQLLIRKDQSNHLKGMVTRHDILNFIMDADDLNDQLLEQTIDTISQKNIITTDPKSEIRRVAKVMIDFNLNAIPVVDKNDIILGVVTRHDIVKAVASSPDLQMWA